MIYNPKEISNTDFVSLVGNKMYPVGFYKIMFDSCSLDNQIFYKENDKIYYLINYINRDDCVPVFSVSRYLSQFESPFFELENSFYLVSKQDFIEEFIAKRGPTTDWLLFNQDIWNR